MTKKSLKVDRAKFEGIVQNLLQHKPLKRSKVKVSKRKPEKVDPAAEMKRFYSVIRTCTIERYA